MDAKFMARALSFLSIFLAIYAQSQAFQLEAAIYYGDLSVEIGKPFSITCIIPITDPIYWIKDGESITRHNLRHGRDEHSYMLSESAIEGEKHKIEAHISVRHALKVHEGRYQCNNLHSSYHMLQVRAPKPELSSTKPQMKLPHFAHGPEVVGRDDSEDDVIGRHLATESIYESIYDLTPSKINDVNGDSDEIFTRTWEAAEPDATPPQLQTLPTQLTTTKAITTQQHHRTHHHHHQVKQQQYAAQLPKSDYEQKHKLLYVNVTNFDGMAGTEKQYEISPGLINIQYNPGDYRYTTEPWRSSTIYYSATPPIFPPPRTAAPKVHQSAASADAVEYSQGHYHGGDGTSRQVFIGNNHNNKHRNQQETYYVVTGDGDGPGHPTDTSSQYPVQFGQLPPLPPVPPYHQHPSQHHHHQQQKQLQQFNTMVTFPAHTSQATTRIFQNPFLQYNNNNNNQHQIQRIAGQQLQQPNYITLPPGGTFVATSPPLFASSPSNAYGFVPPVQLSTLTSTPLLTQNTNAINTLLTQLNQEHEPDFLVPNYDNAEHQLKVFEIRSPLVLSCNITKEGSHELTWEKNGTDVSKVKELEGRYRILAVERKFIIDRTAINDDGLYSCVADNQKKDFNVVAVVAVRVPSNVGVVEGEKLSIECTVVGTDPQLSWSFGNMTITNTTGRYVLKPNDNNVQNAILSVDNISLNDRGEFTCIGQNAATLYTNFKEASDVSYVRIKGRLAALWPFLGICAEVLILCSIILIYEKRRNKTELEESDTDPQEH